MLKLETLQKDIQQLSAVCVELRSQIETHVRTLSADKNSRYSQICLYFDEIIRHVINRNAILTVRLNREGHERRPDTPTGNSSALCLIPLC